MVPIESMVMIEVECKRYPIEPTEKQELMSLE